MKSKLYCCYIMRLSTILYILIEQSRVNSIRHGNNRFWFVFLLSKLICGSVCLAFVLYFGKQLFTITTTKKEKNQYKSPHAHFPVLPSISNHRAHFFRCCFQRWVYVISLSCFTCWLERRMGNSTMAREREREMWNGQKCGKLPFFTSNFVNSYVKPFTIKKPWKY